MKKNHRQLWILILLLVAFGSAGCAEKKDGGEPIENVKPSLPVGANDRAPLTKEDCNTFGKSLEKAIVAADDASLRKMFRYHELAERSMSGVELPEDSRKMLLSALINAKFPPISVPLMAVVQNGGSYKVVRVAAGASPPRALMRLSGQGGLNYHDIHLARHADGAVVAHDVYVFGAGELLTQTLRRGWFLTLPEDAQNSNSLREKLQGPDREYFENLQKLVAMFRASKQGRNQEAVDQYRRLPASLQKNKALQLMAIPIAHAANREEYARLVEDFRRDHPNDPAIDLISIGYLRQLKKFDECLKAIDGVDKSIGGDPYLWVFRAEVMIECDRLGDAKVFSERSVAVDPSLEQGYLTRIRVSLREKKHEDTLSWLRKGIEAINPPVDLAQMKANPEYAAFVASPQFQEFEEWYKARQK